MKVHNNLKNETTYACSREKHMLHHNSTRNNGSTLSLNQ